jgi:hypothetical protein
METFLIAIGVVVGVVVFLFVYRTAPEDLRQIKLAEAASAEGSAPGRLWCPAPRCTLPSLTFRRCLGVVRGF